jgi:hypothetical protein
MMFLQSFEKLRTADSARVKSQRAALVLEGVAVPLLMGCA